MPKHAPVPFAHRSAIGFSLEPRRDHRPARRAVDLPHAPAIRPHRRRLEARAVGAGESRAKPMPKHAPVPFAHRSAIGFRNPVETIVPPGVPSTHTLRDAPTSPRARGIKAVGARLVAAARDKYVAVVVDVDRLRPVGRRVVAADVDDLRRGRGRAGAVAEVVRQRHDHFVVLVVERVEGRRPGEREPLRDGEVVEERYRRIADAVVIVVGQDVDRPSAAAGPARAERARRRGEQIAVRREAELPHLGHAPVVVRAETVGELHPRHVLERRIAPRHRRRRPVVPHHRPGQGAVRPERWRVGSNDVARLDHVERRRGVGYVGLRVVPHRSVCGSNRVVRLRRCRVARRAGGD